MKKIYKLKKVMSDFLFNIINKMMCKDLFVHSDQKQNVLVPKCKGFTIDYADYLLVLHTEHYYV